jgi:hypothetical protein
MTLTPPGRHFWQAIIRKYVGISVKDAKIMSLDRLGLNMMGSYTGVSMKVRVVHVPLSHGSPAI